MMVKYSDIIKRISAIRQRVNMSARELSLELGKSGNYISKAECCDFNIPLDIVLDICSILNVQPEELFADNFESYKQDNALLQSFKSLNVYQKQLFSKLFDELSKK